MASINDRREIGDEIVLRVRKTDTGAKVIEFNGVGFADGIMTKRNRRYCYGDDPVQKATDYAYRMSDEIATARECPVTVVEQGETIAEKLGGVSE